MREPGKLPTTYWYVWFAGLVSSLGDGFALVGLPLLAHSLTTDARLITSLYVAQRLPWLLFSLVAGSWVDRRDPRRVVVGSDLFRGAVLASLVAWYGVSELSVVALLLVAFLLGVAETTHSAATQAMIPAMLSDEVALSKGNGYLFTAQVTGEQMAGPALGGWLFGLSTSLPLLGDALSFFLSAAFVRRIRVVRKSSVRAGVSIKADIREALHWFRNDRLLVVTTALTTLASFGQGMVLSVLVLFAIDEMKLSKAGYGVLVAIIALGNVIGGLVAHRVLRFISLKFMNLGGTLMMGVLYLLASATESSPVVAICLLLEGVIVALLNVNNRTLRQARIPAHLIGKVVNFIRSLVLGAAPLGALIAGLVVEGSRPSTSLRYAGVVLIIVAVGSARPLIRAVDADAPSAPPTDEVVDWRLQR